MSVAGATESIRRAVLAWESVEEHDHRFGGSEYRVGRREIGHVHGDRLVDIPFPKRIRDVIVGAGQAEPHHILPDSGWVSVHLRSEADVQAAIRLLRRSYELAMAQKAKTERAG